MGKILHEDTTIGVADDQNGSNDVAANRREYLARRGIEDVRLASGVF